MHMQQYAQFLEFKPSELAAAALLAAIRVENAQIKKLDPTIELKKEVKLWQNAKLANFDTEFTTDIEMYPR